MIVAISREYGTGALEIARELGTRLRYAVVHDQLPVVVATRLGISRDAAEKMGMKAPLADRIVRSFASSAPESFATADPNEIDEAYDREVDRAVEEAAAGGDAVIIGRAAGLVLRGRSDLLRVFLRAPVAFRAARIVRALGIDERAAAHEIRRVDGARAEYVRRRFNADWHDVEAYDLTIDVGRFGIERAADLIAGAVRGLE